MGTPRASVRKRRPLQPPNWMAIEPKLQRSVRGGNNFFPARWERPRLLDSEIALFDEPPPARFEFDGRDAERRLDVATRDDEPAHGVPAPLLHQELGDRVSDLIDRRSVREVVELGERREAAGDEIRNRSGRNEAPRLVDRDRLPEPGRAQGGGRAIPGHAVRHLVYGVRRRVGKRGEIEEVGAPRRAAADEAGRSLERVAIAVKPADDPLR